MRRLEVSSFVFVFHFLAVFAFAVVLAVAVLSWTIHLGASIRTPLDQKVIRCIMVSDDDEGALLSGMSVSKT